MATTSPDERPPSAAAGGPMRICLVSDFFCPNTGGVETHMYYLAQCLIRRGHYVVVVTHAYGGDRRAIRYLSNGLKVYYMSLFVFYNGCVLPTVVAPIPWLRRILLRERIQLVHGHSSFSALAHECLFTAGFMGMSTVFTDHSLFGFADASSIVTNKLLQFFTSGVDHVVCVSHTSKENTVLRARLRPHRVSVIPNAVDTDQFQPDPAAFERNPLTIVVVSRLVYRKGADLLAALVPLVCAALPHCRWLIAGDGPKRVLLEQARERHRLHHRVHMLGTVPHTAVRQVLVQGHIFLNTSLTEAFCMTIVEAASCGLRVVATDVGGVPEVLPADMCTLCAPDAGRLLEALCHCARGIEAGRARWAAGARRRHERVAAMYYWPDVAERTERVYRMALDRRRETLAERFASYFRCGFGFGLFFSFVAGLVLTVLRVLQFIQPDAAIAPADDRPRRKAAGVS